MPVRPLRDPLGHSRFSRMGSNWKAFAKAQALRRREAARVNDDGWRDKLKPHRQHPRREKRGQGKPR